MQKFFSFILLLLVAQTIFSQELKMETNWEKAQELAQSQDKNILVIITGSNWCAPCKKMEKNVLSSTEFKEYANKNLIVFLVDYRTVNGSLDLGSEYYRNYMKFKEKFQSDKLPDLILVNKNGQKIKSLKGRLHRLKNVMKQLD